MTALGAVIKVPPLWRDSGQGGCPRDLPMSDGELPQSPDNLDARLKRAEQARQRSATGGKGLLAEPASGFGWALRIGVELVSALIVGVGIGYLIDRWLGTSPWFLVVFFFLGAGAGILNVYRAASGIGLAPGYRKPNDEKGPAGTGRNDDGATQGRDQGGQAGGG